MAKRLQAMTYLRLILIILLCTDTVGAYGDPPPGVDPNSPIAQWYHKQLMPGSNNRCCDMADGQTVDYDMTPNGYVVHLNNTIIKVPDRAVITMSSNPTGRGVVWLNKDGESSPIRCFAPASGT
jgi:hypothetical protein